MNAGSEAQPVSSELLGTLAELRGFVTDAERSRLGAPVRTSATSDALQDLCDATPSTFSQADDDDLLRLYDLRVEVACLCLSTLNDTEIETLGEKTGLPQLELEAARDLASDAMNQGVDARRKAAWALLRELGSAGEGDHVETQDLLGHVRRLGRWPGDLSSPLVRKYRRALGNAVVRHSRFAIWRAHRLVHSPSQSVLLTALDGLREALDRFDPHRGTSVTTYASQWIRQRVQRALVNFDTDVRMPVHIWVDRGNLLRVIHESVVATGTVPTLAELRATPELSGMNVERVVRFGLETWRDAWTPTCPGGPSESDRLFDATHRSSHRATCAEDLRSVVVETVGELDDRLRDIIVRRFGLAGPSETLQVIGESYNVTRERIRQLETQALEKLVPRMASDLADIVHSLEPG